MDIPESLRNRLRLLEDKADSAAVIRLAGEMSAAYREKSHADKYVVDEKQRAVTYALTRMPATCAAFCAVLSRVSEELPLSFSTLLDVGAGTGAASFAADAFYPLEKITCFERESAMVQVGQELMRSQDGALSFAEWTAGDVLCGLPAKGELVTAGYLLNEIAPEQRERALGNLWASSEKALLLVEPGTPDGFARLCEAKRSLRKLGAILAFPCPIDCDCPVEGSDWCAFSCRVQRSRLHRLAKGGDAPFEDEKYACALFVRQPVERKNASLRIVRHPFFDKGSVSVRVCDGNAVKDRRLGKKDGDSYKKARKAESGDCL